MSLSPSESLDDRSPKRHRQSEGTFRSTPEGFFAEDTPPADNMMAEVAVMVRLFDFDPNALVERVCKPNLPTVDEEQHTSPFYYTPPYMHLRGQAEVCNLSCISLGRSQAEF